MQYFIVFLVAVFGVTANLKSQKRHIPLNKKVWNADRIFILCSALVLFFILMLQDTDSNGDLILYSDSYSTIGYRSFAYFGRNWKDMKDPFYFFCTWCFSKIGFDFYAWKTLVSFFFVFSFYRLILRYSVNPAMSLIVFLTLGLYAFSFSGLRQTLALAVIMCTYPYLKEKKLLRFILCVVVAALFHRTALIFLVAYPIYRLQAKIRNLIFIVLAGAVVLVNANAITRLYLSVAGAEDDYSRYLEMDNSLSVAGIVVWGCIWIFCTVFLYRKKANASDPRLCNLLLVSLIIRILSTVWVAEFFRISMYFSVFECLAIADACAAKEKSTLVVRFKTAGVSAALLLYSLISPSENFISYQARNILNF